jgi:hypothetical protein
MSKELSFRSNKFAQPNNMVNAYLTNEYETSPITFAYTVDGTAANVVLAATLPANNVLSYLRVTITDANGIEAVGQFDVANIAAGANVVTSALNKGADWLVQIVWAEPKASQDEPAFGSIEFLAEGAKPGASGTFNTTNVAGTLEVFYEVYEDGVKIVPKTTIADAGTIALGASVGQNKVVVIRLYFSNTATGNNPLRILSIVDDAAKATINTEFANKPFLPAEVAPETQSVAYQDVDIDTTALGSLASVITITSDDPANASYVVNVSGTVV